MSAADEPLHHPLLDDQGAQAPSAGQRLRTWRAARGLTLRDISRQTGIPVPALSKLENGKQSLGYPRLLKLSALLGVELGQLLSSETPPLASAGAPLGRRSINRHDEAHTFDDDQLADRYLATELRQKAMTPIICDVTVQASGEPESWSRHPGEEFVLVLSGKLEFHSEIYAPVVLAAGDSIYFDAAVGHNYFSADGRMCQFLSVVQSPAVGTQSRRAPSPPSRGRSTKASKTTTGRPKVRRAG
jgi:transcriptional regulator with XRE-family HTH domain